MSDYTEAVESGLEGLEAVSTGVCPGCDDCRERAGYVAEEDGDGNWTIEAAPDTGSFAKEEDANLIAADIFRENWEKGNIDDEPHFSPLPCGICGTHLGGDRHTWHFILPDPTGSVKGQSIHHETDCCTDCLLYLANGDEPEQWRHFPD